MKRNILFSAMVLMAGSLIAADSSPKDEVAAAAKKLGEKDNYSWKQTVTVPENAQFKPGPTEGKTEKDGYTYLSWSFGDNTYEGIVKGDKGAATDRDGLWQSFAELEDGQGFGRFTVTRLKNLKTPAVQAADLAAATTDLKKDGDVYSSDVTEQGAKEFLRFGRNSEIKDAKASVKFWLKDGELTKYEVKASGKSEFKRK